MKFNDLFIKSVDVFCANFDEKNYVEPGTNGPHNHKETPVRNTSHWVISLCHAYNLTGEEKYKEKAIWLQIIITDTSIVPSKRTVWRLTSKLN